MEGIDQVIEQCRNQNRLAQKKLFETFGPKLYAVSRRYTPSSSDPMDNLHDAFIKIFEKINQFDSQKGSFDAWARKIVINCALNKCEKQKLHLMVVNNYQQNTTDDFSVVEKMSIDEIQRLIEQMPDGYKQVFCLHEIEGYSHAEIGEMLNIKESSSRSQLTRARKILQELVLEVNRDMPPAIKIR